MYDQIPAKSERSPDHLDIQNAYNVIKQMFIEDFFHILLWIRVKSFKSIISMIILCTLI